MLVVYSSSSEEEDSSTSQRDCEEDACPVKKKSKVESPKITKLPLPHSVLNMFQDDLDRHTEDSSLHSGRIRSFKHERGNWATYVYLPYNPVEEFTDILEKLVSISKSRGIDLMPQEEFHLSLSQTVVLRHHWIQPFTQSLKAGLAHCRRFICSAEKLKVYCNAEKTRTFLGAEVSTGHTQLLDIIKVVDKTMTDFRLETFYENPSFHVSLAWCIGDLTAQLTSCLKELQNIMDSQEDSPFTLTLICAELRCRTGNKVFSFPIES